jgi:hypothetical protein
VDNKAINKLIRSEVWPVLRRHGFTHFESRYAYQYRDPFINVVSFHSSNAYDYINDRRDFTFDVRLGVYVLGSGNEDRMARTRKGHLVPRDHDCPFRTGLQKGSPVDGFSDPRAFYIDTEGHTVGPCFNEVVRGLEDEGLKWFASLNDLDAVLDRFRQRAEFKGIGGTPSLIAASGSFAWHDLGARLFRLRADQDPSGYWESAVLAEIEGLVGSVLDLDWHGADREGSALKVRQLLGQRHLDSVLGSVTNRRAALLSPFWELDLPNIQPVRVYADGVGSPRKLLWPILREAGFHEFTDRLAFKAEAHRVQVVEVEPIDQLERKYRGLPNGLFRVGVGVFWPALAEAGLFRCDKQGHPRPRVDQSHISDWLTPTSPTHAVARSTFTSLGDAIPALEYALGHWFPTFGEEAALTKTLEKRDLHLYCSYPMLGGIGARGSVRRLVIEAYCAHSLGFEEKAREYLADAESALELRTLKNRKERARTWIDLVKAAIDGPKRHRTAGIV